MSRVILHIKSRNVLKITGDNTEVKAITLHSTNDIHQPDLTAQKLKGKPSKYNPFILNTILSILIMLSFPH